MKKFLILGFTMLLFSIVFGQKIPPANWSHTVNKKEVKVGEIIEVTFETIVPKGYHTPMITVIVRLKNQYLLTIRTQAMSLLEELFLSVLITIKMRYLSAK